MVAHWELLVRIVAGMFLGGIIGYERDVHGRPAGLRTHMIVGLASATFMVVSTQFVYFQHYAKDDLVGVDSSRIAASVVSGMGFLAGGAILRSGITVQGLTTAAGLWLVAAIGLCAGGGLFIESVVVTLVGVTALTFFRRFEDKDDHIAHRRLVLELGEGTPFRAVVERLERLKLRIVELEHEVRPKDGRSSYVCEVRMPSTLDVDTLIDAIRAFDGVLRIHLEPRR